MAVKGNIVIDQGANFETTISVTDDDGNAINLTGYTGAAQMRKHYTSSAQTAFTVVVSALAGEVTLTMNANTTGSLTPGRYVYDCEITDTSNVVSRIVEGIVTVTPQVTR
jgi:hypothetical protein